MGFKRKKLSNVELADMDEDTRVRIEKILDGVKSSRDFDEAVVQPLKLLIFAPFFTSFTATILAPWYPSMAYL